METKSQTTHGEWQSLVERIQKTSCVKPMRIQMERGDYQLATAWIATSSEENIEKDKLYLVSRDGYRFSYPLEEMCLKQANENHYTMKCHNGPTFCQLDFLTPEQVSDLGSNGIQYV